MFHPIELVIIVLAICAFAVIVQAKYGGRRDQQGDGNHPGDAESARLREEVTALKERLAVLERITVEKENSLEREIERLRDR